MFETSFEEIQRLRRQSQMARKKGEYARGVHLAEQACHLGKSAFGTHHSEYAALLNNLAVLYWKMGRWGEAEPLLCQAMEICKQQLGDRHPSYAKSLNNLATLYQEMGRLREAEPLHRQAMEIWKQQLGDRHPDYATSLNNLAGLYHEMGRWGEAEPLFCQAMEIRKQQLGDRHPDYATSLNNLAALYKTMGRWGEAESLYRQGMEIWKQQLGDRHPDYAQSLNNLALLYYHMGRLSEAESLFCQAMEIRKQQLGEGHPYYATSLNNLAGLYKDMGRWGEAEPLHRQAMEIRKQQLGDRHPDYASSLNNLAGLYQKMGRWGEAEPLCRQGMEIWKQQLGEGHPTYATSLNNLASLYLATNRPNAAFELMQDAITIQNRVLGEVFAISSDRQRLAYLEQSYWQLEQFLSLVQQHFSHDPWVKQAALDVLLQRKGLATEAGLVLRTSILSQRYRHLAPQYEEYRELIRQQAYLQFQAPPQLQDKLPQQLQALRQKQEALEQVLGRQIPEMNLEQQLKQANCQAIAANLPPGSSLVEFVQYRPYNFSAIPGEPSWSSPRYLAFILTAGQPEAVEMLDLGEVAPIDEDCRRFRRWASGENSKSSPDSRVAALDIPETAQDTPSYDYPEVGKHLYQRLIQPLTPYLSPQQVLYLCPDGELTTLPFGLLSGDGIQELMGEFELRYLNVGRDILRLTVKIPVQLSQPLVIANPDFNLGLHLPQQESLVAAASPQGRQFRLRLPREVILATLVSLGFFGVLLLLALFPEWVGGLLLLGILLLPVVLPRWLELSDSANPGVSSAVGSSAIRADDLKSGPSLADRAKMAVNLGSLRRELGSQEKLPFSPLPGTQLEGERVAQFLGVAAYLDGQAVKSLLSQCRSPKVLHLATHGYFLGLTSQESPTAETASEMAWGGKLASGLDPLTRSGLALAGANTALVSPGELPVEAEEGLLTAQGTMGLDLTGTWLVVLSACDTALGGKSIGEGVMGLRRSFILAGAETVVMSLWPVPDVPTAILMNRFYENLFERGLPRTKGLEEAQAYLRGLRVGQIRQTWLTDKVIARVGVISYKSGQWLKELSGKPDDWRPFVSPKFWAAFVCIGDFREIGGEDTP